MTIHSDIRDGETRPLHQDKGAAPEILYVPRYTGLQRVNHWITAILFTLLTLSGLAMFSPYLFSLTGLFGGGQATRAIHPWFGVVLAISFVFLFVRFWRLNIPNKDDLEWTKKIGDVVTNREDRLPELGKYNAGQKMVFWGQTALIAVMFVSGLVIWNTYFGGLTTIETQRWALLATRWRRSSPSRSSWCTSTPASGCAAPAGRWSAAPSPAAGPTGITASGSARSPAAASARGRPTSTGRKRPPLSRTPGASADGDPGSRGRAPRSGPL